MSTKESIHNDLEWVLAQGAGTLTWKLKEYELIDLIHEVAIYGDPIYDDNGSRMGFGRLIRTILPIFGYKPNKNPSKTITWLMGKSDYIPMSKRYDRKVEQGKERPILDFIKAKVLYDKTLAF